VNIGGLTLNFWDGAAGPKFDGAIGGGDGVWQSHVGNDNWTDLNGALNAGFSDGAVAIFGGNAGTVAVDNSLGAVTASGMQFATNGYTLTGDAVTLTGAQAVIRVGDGSAAGAGYVATIGSTLSGASQLVKTDSGTLVLGGANSYTGGTLVTGGTVQIAADANLGAAAG
ncbi:MAG: autotransporter-associated beta strand repeat-containing protein, partial [Sphingopyxis sp.]|nr:autotransporter-associated beta strand repeat-containing protein [Sphingopyxis sp.]